MREVIAMAWPIMLGAVSFAIMDFTDRVFVSRYGEAKEIGDTYLAAIGSSGVWSYTLGVFFIGITGCVSTFVAQSYGRGEFHKCARFAWQGVYLSLFAGAFGLLMYPLSGWLFHRMGHAPDVTELEISYFQIRLFGYTFLAWQSGMSAFFTSVSRPKIPMAAAMIANVANVALDYALIFGKFGLPELGMEGAAIATVIAQIAQATILQAVFMSRRVDREYQSRSTWRFDWVKTRDLLRIGWPSGVSGLTDVAAWAIFTSFIVGAFSTAQLAGHNGAVSYLHLMFIPLMGLNFAATAVTGQWIGRGNIARAKQRAYVACGLGVVFMVSVGTFLAWNGKALMQLFTSDAVAVDVGSTLLIFAAVFAGFDVFTIVFLGALRGAGDTRWIMVTVTAGAYLVQLPLACLLAFGVGLEAKGAWLGSTIYIIGLSGVFFWRFKSEKWRDIRIFSEDREDVTMPTTPVPESDPVRIPVDKGPLSAK